MTSPAKPQCALTRGRYRKLPRLVIVEPDRPAGEARTSWLFVSCPTKNSVLLKGDADAEIGEHHQREYLQRSTGL